MVLPKWASSIVSDARSALVGVGVLSLGAFLWAVFGRWLAVPQAIVGSVIVFGSLSVAWNQWRQAFDRDRRKRLANRSPEEIERWVRDWLFKLKYQNRNDPSPEAHFQIVVTKEDGGKLTIALLKAHPFVVIAARLVPDQSEEAKETNAILLDPSSNFAADLAVELAHLGVDYRVDATKQPIEVGIERKVMFDETMTELGFGQEFLKVEGAVGMVFGVATRAVNTAKARKAIPPPPSSKRDR